MELHRRKREGDVGKVLREEEEFGHLVGARDEDGIRVALKAGEDGGAEVLDVNVSRCVATEGALRVLH